MIMMIIKKNPGI